MRKIRKILRIWPAALLLLACACDEGLNVRQAYSFELVTMPVQKRIALNQTAEIRCQLVKEGNYKDAAFTIRYFQSDGVGELKMDDGTLLLPNDRHPLNKDTFRLYYTSLCTDNQVIDVYVEDSFGQMVQKTFSFINFNPGDEDILE